MRSLRFTRQSVVQRQEGVALLVTLMVLMLVSALMVGFVTAIVADQRASGLDRDQTQAYAAAHAGLEQLTSDLSGLFTTDFSPSSAQINTLTATPPSLPGFQFLDPSGGSGYRITFTPDALGNPAPEDVNGSTISAGPYQGFRGIITPYNITVTARSRGGAEVRMRRTLQTVAVPVFQFGLFSENDLSFHAGPNFNFGGRVHTNANLYLAQGNANTLTLADRVTAVGEIIRTHLVNGWDGATNYTGTVQMLKTAPSTFRALARTEGSLVTNNPAVQNEPLWTSLSIGTYSSNIRNGRTGARRLDLPLVSQGARPVDLIRRPVQNSNEDTAQPLVYQQRFYSQAALRILLSDTAADIMSLPTVTPIAPVPLGNLAVTPVPGYMPGGMVAPFATSGGAPAAPPAVDYTSPAGTPLLNGFIKIEQRTPAGAWQDVTLQILNFGIAGRNLSSGALNVPGAACPAEPQPTAIIRLQRVKDVPAGGLTWRCGLNAGVMSQVSTDYWPNALYDPREGNVRDNIPTASTNISLGGVMQYVELDVNNLRRWIAGDPAFVGGTGPQTRSDNGYIVYFSDRRNNRNGAAETAEYGFEDVVNPADVNGVPNGVLDAGEDINGDGALDQYGRLPVNVPSQLLPPVASMAPWDANARPWTTTNVAAVARANRQIFFRRALKIVNGGLNQIPAPGLTIVSENPVYVQGNFNALATNTVAEPNMACAIIADAVTLLSNNWNDIRSFVSPNNTGGRAATTTGYRMAIIGGKNMPFQRPTNWASAQDFGTDGGAHNFLRYIEAWGGQTLNYRGSVISFYTARQAVGIYKCCQNVYGPPARGYNFDSDFLVPNLLPPGTPMFRDVNTLTFRQLLRPTQ